GTFGPPPPHGVLHAVRPVDERVIDERIFSGDADETRTPSRPVEESSRRPGASLLRPEGARWLPGTSSPWLVMLLYQSSRPEGGRSPAMPSAYTQNYYHTVFSTKQRMTLITPEVESRLYPFIGGIVRDLRCQLLAVNGMPDHIHLLIRYRADLSHSDMLQQIKGRSSKWINETFRELGHFSWQEGYSGFTV